MERLPQDWVNKKVNHGEIPCRRNQGRLRKRWLDGVQETLSRHGVKTSKIVSKARNERNDTAGCKG